MVRGISRYVHQLTAIPYSCALHVTDLERPPAERPLLGDILRAARFAVAGSRAEQAYWRELLPGADIRLLDRSAAAGEELFSLRQEMAAFRRWLMEPIVETAVFPSPFNPQDLIIDSPYSPLVDGEG